MKIKIFNVLSDAFYLIIGGIIIFALMKQCEGVPKTVTKTVTKIEIVHDTIKEVKIDTFKQKVYVQKIITKEGETIIHYKDKPSEDTINASQQSVEILSNEATAKLSITHTGELLDVSGIITFPKVEKTVETIITRDASGFYIYGSMPISSQINPEVGVMLQIKNKLIIGAGVQYNDFTRNLDARVTLAVKL
jgi:hypothetical protein